MAKTTAPQTYTWSTGFSGPWSLGAEWVLTGTAGGGGGGRAGGGGGGGGGGATFFLQAPSVMMALSANTTMIHFILPCFTCPPCAMRPAFRLAVISYFQLQLGWLLVPCEVNCVCFVPSASMVQICRLPDRFD